MRTIVWSMLAIVGVVVSASPVQAETKLGYSTYLPPTHVNNTAGIEPMARRLEKESNGAIKIEMFTGGSVAKAMAAVDSIRDGLVAAGLDLIWMGVLVVMLLEIELLTPPFGLNAFVIKSVVGDTVSLSTIFRGLLWFIAVDIVVVILLVAFLQISLYLPSLLE